MEIQGDIFATSLPLWSDWLHSQGEKEKSYFITMTFDRYRDFYLIDRNRVSDVSTVSRSDIANGLARKMPEVEAARELVGDVNRWYLRLLNALCGGRYGDHRQLHPKAVGFLDDPAHKRLLSDHKKRLPGERFRHAHLVMTISGAQCPHKVGVNMISEFERLWKGGALEAMWKRFNSDGDLHVKEAYDTARGIDYAAKSAKRSIVYQENMILLPFRH